MSLNESKCIITKIELSGNEESGLRTDKLDQVDSNKEKGNIQKILAAISKNSLTYPNSSGRRPFADIRPEQRYSAYSPFHLRINKAPFM